MATDKSSFLNRKLPWFILIFIILAAFAVVFIPVWIIQPFKPQTTRGVEMSYLLRRVSPWITLIALGVGLLLAFKLWRGSRRWWKWNFTGRAILGALNGKQLTRVAVLNDYWFDWQTYHPGTLVYELGNR